jgi:hypothetical protein
MIRDVEIWREELKRLRTDFEKACVQNIAFEIERTLYYSALVTRKFSETPFVRRGFLGPVIKSRKFALVEGCLDGSSWTGEEFHFDFGKPIVGAQVSILEICHILIHSRFLEWRPATGEIQKILAGGVRDAIEFTPSEYASLLQKVENYKFSRGPRRRVRRKA